MNSTNPNTNTPVPTSSINSTALSDLPRVMEFDNLHITGNLKAAVIALKSVGGVYAIIHTVSGKHFYIYIYIKLKLPCLTDITLRSLSPLRARFYLDVRSVPR